MHWIKKHPNSTLLIVWIGGFAIYLSAIFALAESTNAIWLIVIFIIYAIGLILTTGWVLRRKGKSLNNLFLFLFIGIIPILIALLAEEKPETEDKEQ
ncbi:hypothetical protein ES704_01946 [subsurface metagenome]